MIPPKDDPRWRSLVTTHGELQLSALATKMVMTRVRMLTGADATDEKISEAITIAYDFFKKNEYTVAEDIKSLFGEGQ